MNKKHFKHSIESNISKCLGSKYWANWFQFISVNDSEINQFLLKKMINNYCIKGTNNLKLRFYFINFNQNGENWWGLIFET